MEEKNIQEIEQEECCCGHDSHEHHEHHQEHEHEHEHEHHHHEHGHHHHEHEHEHEHHHHDHDEHCDCGDEHHHHHHGDHDHDHDHDHHHHDHGHQYDVPGFRIFETHDHEGATICSFEKDVMTDVSDTVGKMQDCINALEKWLDETDATIGHLKGYVKEAGPVTTFSTVGYGLNVEKHEGAGLAIGFASIVFGPSEEELKEKVAEIFAVL